MAMILQLERADQTLTKDRNRCPHLTGCNYTRSHSNDQWTKSSLEWTFSISASARDIFLPHALNDIYGGSQSIVNRSVLGSSPRKTLYLLTCT